MEEDEREEFVDITIDDGVLTLVHAILTLERGYRVSEDEIGDSIIAALKSLGAEQQLRQ